MANYPVDPTYNAEIRQIEDTDAVKASTVLNPVIKQMIGNTAAVKGNVDELRFEGTTTGTATAYTLTVDGIATLGSGLRVLAKLHVTNGDEPTIDINGLGAKAIYGANGDRPSAGDFVAGAYISLVYNGTSFFVLGGSGSRYPVKKVTGKASRAFARDSLAQLVNMAAINAVSGATGTISQVGFMSTDGLTYIYIASASQIAVRNRPDINSAFGTATTIGINVSAIGISGDGLTIACVFSQSTRTISVITRPDKTSNTWTAKTLVNGLTGGGAFINISDDGCTILFGDPNTTNGGLRTFTRPDIASSTWTAQAVIVPTDYMSGNWIMTRDSLRLIECNGVNSMRVRSRSSKVSNWSTVANYSPPTGMSYSGGVLSDDELTLYVLAGLYTNSGTPPTINSYEIVVYKRPNTASNSWTRVNASNINITPDKFGGVTAGLITTYRPSPSISGTGFFFWQPNSTVDRSVRVQYLSGSALVLQSLSLTINSSAIINPPYSPYLFDLSSGTMYQITEEPTLMPVDIGICGTEVGRINSAVSSGQQGELDSMISL